MKVDREEATSIPWQIVVERLLADLGFFEKEMNLGVRGVLKRWRYLT